MEVVTRNSGSLSTISTLIFVLLSVLILIHILFSTLSVVEADGTVVSGLASMDLHCEVTPG